MNEINVYYVSHEHIDDRLITKRKPGKLKFLPHLNYHVSFYSINDNEIDAKIKNVFLCSEDKKITTIEVDFYDIESFEEATYNWELI